MKNKSFPTLKVKKNQSYRRLPELIAALKATVATLTQPVQFTGIRNAASCDVLRADCGSAVHIAKAALLKAGVKL